MAQAQAIVRQLAGRRRRFSISKAVIHLVLAIVAFLCVMPMLLVISTSLSDDLVVARQGLSLLPQGFTTYTYKFILSNPNQLLRSYVLTTTVTAAGTVGGILVSALMGYALAHREFKLRGIFVFVVVFTMLFNGGMVPTYLIVRGTLGLYNNILALILPTMIIPWYIMMFRTHFATLPHEIMESAKMDGAGEWRMFFQIALPLSRPWLATIGLMYVLKYWNEWIPAMMYIEDPDLFPLQYLLQQIVRNAQFLRTVRDAMTTQIRIPGLSLQMAMVVVAAGPAMFVFMFLQKYFVRGLTAGAVKG
jgi:putative aldouronate transport system permease protein